MPLTVKRHLAPHVFCLPRPRDIVQNTGAGALCQAHLTIDRGLKSKKHGNTIPTIDIETLNLALYIYICVYIYIYCMNNVSI